VNKVLAAGILWKITMTEVVVKRRGVEKGCINILKTIILKGRRGGGEKMHIGKRVKSVQGPI